jgi:hypothetical protein
MPLAALWYNFYVNKIFISIPSLRDPTLEATMKIALKNADNPENVIFGVGAQYYDNEMPEFNFINKNQLKVLKINPDQRPGVVRLRYEISKLITDESYFMSIDSHMLFSPHWDTRCLAWIKELQEKTGKQKVCVTNGRIVGDNMKGDHQIICKISNQNRIGPGGLLKAKSFKDGWLEAVNLSCNFFFAPIEIIKDVGWDPYSHFTWEEQYMFFRVFMSGFDCFIPTTDAVVRQSPDFYFYYVWPDMSKQYWTRLENQDPDAQKLELQRAMTTNEPGNKFSINNSSRNVREFWDRLGQGELFDKYQTS